MDPSPPPVAQWALTVSGLPLTTARFRVTPAMRRLRHGARRRAVVGLRVEPAPPESSRRLLSGAGQPMRTVGVGRGRGPPPRVRPTIVTQAVTGAAATPAQRALPTRRDALAT